MSYSFDLNDSFASFTPPTPPDGCTQCGICLPACPTFQKSKDPEQSPMGRIRLMRAMNKGNKGDITPEKMEKLESCLGCYSCESVCPSKVNFGKLLDESLAGLREQRPLPRITRMMLWLSCRPIFIKFILQITFLAQILGMRTLLSKLGVIKLIGLQRANALLGSIISYPTKLTNRIQKSRNNQRVALFTGCFSSAMEQKIQQATIDVFNALGIEVILPSGQGCCGALHRHNGELETAEKLARNNIDVFSVEGADAIITTSSGCSASLKKYNEWLEKDDALAAPVQDVSYYLSNALASTLNQHTWTFKDLPLKVTLHTPCTLRQNDGQEEAVLDVLQKIPGLEILPLSSEPRCCGAGGSQVLSHPEMANALREDLVNEMRTTGADMLISSNLGCALHLKEGLSQAGMDIPLQHPVQLIAQALVIKNE